MIDQTWFTVHLCPDKQVVSNQWNGQWTGRWNGLWNGLWNGTLGVLLLLFSMLIFVKYETEAQMQEKRESGWGYQVKNLPTSQTA